MRHYISVIVCPGLLIHSPMTNATETGRVGHFIAVHHAQKQVVIAMKGTSSLSDVLTDIIAKAVPVSDATRAYTLRPK
jgi:hypothetical protein